MSIFAKKRPSVEKMVAKLYKRYLKSEEAERNWFKSLSFEQVTSAHSSLGTQIRNEFKLWEYSWEKKIVEGVDTSTEHPDAVSLRVITELWKKVHE